MGPVLEQAVSRWLVRPVNEWEIPGLKTAVHVSGTLNDPGDSDTSWSVELAIPWKALAEHAHRSHRHPEDGDQWRINFSRVEWRHQICRRQVSQDSGKARRQLGLVTPGKSRHAPARALGLRSVFHGMSLAKQPTVLTPPKRFATGSCSSTTPEQSFFKQNKKWAASLERAEVTRRARFAPAYDQPAPDPRRL